MDGREKIKAAFIERDLLRRLGEYCKPKRPRGRPRLTGKAAMKAATLKAAAADVRRLRASLKAQGTSYHRRGDVLVSFVHDQYKGFPWPFTEAELKSQLKRPLHRNPRKK
jgi:hypothetical protein